MPGLNVDCLNNPPSIADLKNAGVDAVRLVSKPDPDSDGVHPAVEQYLADCKANSIFALVVITGESKGRLPANNHGWFQCRNEEDAPPDSVASEPMTPEAYIQEFNTYSETFPQFNWIAGGLCAGDYSASYWSQIAPQLQNCVGFAVHPYLKTPDEAVALVAAHQAVDPTKLAFITEFNCSTDQLPAFLLKSTQVTAGQYWYAAGDWMNGSNTGNCLGYGLLDHADKLAAWQDGIAQLQQRATAPVVAPQPELWVDLANFQGNLTDAMVADMQAFGIVGIWPQAITGLDGRSYTRQQLAKGAAVGFKLGGYVWSFPNVSVAARLPMFDGYALEFLSLDVEQDGSTIWSVNRDFALCDAYIGSLTEMYTAKWFFDRQRWYGAMPWSNRPLCYANYDDDRDLSDFVSFGGWSVPRMHQFTDRQSFGGVLCDVSIRYPAA